VRKDTRIFATLACALASMSLLPAAASAGAQVYTAAAGTAERASTSPLAPALSAPVRSRGARRVRGGARRAAATGAGTAGAARALAGTSPLLANFNGTSSRDSEETNFGLEFEPPDQGLCAGNGYVVEMVNSAYTVFDTHGKVLAGPFNVNGPFNEGLTEFTSDPRCQYEAKTHTWYATILQLNRTFTASALDIAVNTSGDPRKPWTPYRIDTSGEGGVSGPKHRDCPCFGDQPTLGFDSHNLYVTTNEFPIEEIPAYYGANIYAISKKDLIAGAAAPHYAVFYGLKIAGALASSIQPALSSGAPGAEYFLNSIDPTETNGDSIGVWALTEAGVVETGGTPKLSSVVLPSEPFAIPVGGEQKGASSLIEAGDDRMQQTAFAGGTLWGELDSAVNVPGELPQRDAVGWFEVHPALSEGVLSSATTLRKQGYLAVPGNYVMYPAIAPTAAGGAVMVTSITGATRYPAAAYATLAPGASAWGPVTVAAKGTTHYDEEGERWGDYSWAVLDPSGEAAWLATEYMPPTASQTTDLLHNWGTRVLEVPEPTK
jgi:hypothetical protein